MNLDTAVQLIRRRDQNATLAVAGRELTEADIAETALILARVAAEEGRQVMAQFGRVIVAADPHPGPGPKPGGPTHPTPTHPKPLPPPPNPVPAKSSNDVPCALRSHGDDASQQPGTRAAQPELRGAGCAAHQAPAVVSEGVRGGG